MNVVEPHATAIVLVATGALLAAGVASSRASARLGVPLALLFLLIGIVAGSEGIGHIGFDDYHLTYRLGTAALVLILFDGGLRTPAAGVRLVAAPAIVLATVGVAGTAALTAVAAHFLGLDWPFALLVGGIVSSTDAAAVFSVLSATGTQLKRRLGLTLEVESGFNDPMAVILTTALTANALAPGAISLLGLLQDVGTEMVIGGVVGFAIGAAGRLAIRRLKLPASGLYPVFTLGLALLAFGVPTLLHGSGFLGAYLGGLALGREPLAHGSNLRRVHDAMGWLAQVGMFLMLGLLVFPSRVATVAPVGLGLALTIALVARPVVVALCLAPFRYPPREILYIGLVGLRGAVPIVLATIPVMAGVDGARQLFDIVFFIAVVGALLPGAIVPWLTRALKLESLAPPKPENTIEIDTGSTRGVELRSYYIEPNLAVTGVEVRDIPFPEGTAVSVIERAGELVAPRGDMRLESGDHVFVLARREDQPFIELLFGRAEEH
ncbi:MAG: sodium/hydrogen exchanger [Gemmatimonadetes bacterium]|nr:sodium/hydrogen exchanger [Gemmatimonadota bacterium]